MTRRRRGLSPEDQELWGRVVQTARPLKSDPKPVFMPDPAPVPEAKPRFRPTPETARGSYRPTPSRPPPGHDLAHPLSEALAQVPVRMDKRKFQRLSRGKLDPEARIDLHGMTLAQAHGALAAFIWRAHSGGKRL
ncbi:MAG: Smr/MutS family protein, partial [Roseinatronobacter sp.]